MDPGQTAPLGVGGDTPQHGRIQGGQAVRTPLKNRKNIGFLCNTDPGSLKKLPSEHLMLGHHWPTRETPFKLCFTGGRITPIYSGIEILYPLINKKNQIWTPSDKTFWIRACHLYLKKNVNWNALCNLGRHIWYNF